MPAIRIKNGTCRKIIENFQFILEMIPDSGCLPLPSSGDDGNNVKEAGTYTYTHTKV